MRPVRACALLPIVAALAGPAGGCAAQRAQGPLAIHLGLTPPATARAVRDYDFCRRADADAADDRSEETFAQCGRPGVVYGDAWVVAHYQDGRVIKLQRFERWADAGRAASRWNQLIERYTVDGPASQEARDRIFGRQRIPEGTEAWVAFDRGEELIGLYLLRPADASAPSILEEIVPRVPTPPRPELNPSR
jgi:hypothetical protein